MAIRLLKRWAFETMRAHWFWLEVKEFNAPARHFYESEGFVFEGTMRECSKEPARRFASMYIMSALEQEYRQSYA